MFISVFRAMEKKSAINKIDIVSIEIPKRFVMLMEVAFKKHGILF